MPFAPRFSLSQVTYWSSRYDYVLEEHVVNEVSPGVRQRGYFTKPELVGVCRWKTPRTQRWCAANSEDFVQEVTGVALSTGNERLRIEVLTLLAGVNWPT